MSSARSKPPFDDEIAPLDASGGPSRRDFLAQAAALPFLSLIALGLAGDAHAQSASATEATLIAFLDTLLPADGTSPAASRLDVHRDILAASRQAPNYPELLLYGAQWLNQMARSQRRADFAALVEADRVRIVELMEQAKAGTAPQVYFERVRADAFRIYYAKPASWTALRFRGPPQPAGFPDFAGKVEL